MEQMQRGGRQIPNIDSLHSCTVITAQLDGGSCQMGEWHQCEQDLDIKLHAMWIGCYTTRASAAAAAAAGRKKTHLTNSRKTQRKTW